MAHGKRRHGAERGESFDLLSVSHAELHGTNSDDITRVAQRAAQLIAEGLTDYRAAKLKAARQLGIDARATMPDNNAIDAALRSHYALFACESQPQALAALRDIATTVMSRLRAFEPWLVGPVLTGTANSNSDIDIEMIGIDPKRFEMYLLDSGIAFTLREPLRRRGGKGSTDGRLTFATEFDNVPVLITHFESHAARLAAHPRGSIRHERAQLAEAKVRFAAVSKP